MVNNIPKTRFQASALVPKCRPKRGARTPDRDYATDLKIISLWGEVSLKGSRATQRCKRKSASNLQNSDPIERQIGTCVSFGVVRYGTMASSVVHHHFPKLNGSFNWGSPFPATPARALRSVSVARSSLSGPRSQKLGPCQRHWDTGNIHQKHPEIDIGTHWNMKHD